MLVQTCHALLSEKTQRSQGHWADATEISGKLLLLFLLPHIRLRILIPAVNTPDVEIPICRWNRLSDASVIGGRSSLVLQAVFFLHFFISKSWPHSRLFKTLKRGWNSKLEPHPLSCAPDVVEEEKSGLASLLNSPGNSCWLQFLPQPPPTPPPSMPPDTNDFFASCV